MPMRIKVTFDNEWTKEEMREYLSNMENERYQDLNYDELLELAACSSIYFANDDRNVHLSPPKADAILLYFMKNEPTRLDAAEIINSRLSLK